MSETEYHYIRGQGWVPKVPGRSISKLNFNKTLNITIIDRVPLPGELGNWCLAGDYYAEGDVLDMERIMDWGANCMSYVRGGKLIGARLIPEGGVDDIDVYLDRGQHAIWFTIQVNEV